MAEPEFPSEIRDAARAAWHRYVDFLSPFRPGLYKYCRRLTGDIWDAEDLVQDTVVRGFGVLNRSVPGRAHSKEVRSPLTGKTFEPVSLGQVVAA